MSVLTEPAVHLEETGPLKSSYSATSVDYVHFVIPDIHGIPRGRVVPKRFIDETMKNGIELFYGTLLFGPCTEATDEIEELEVKQENRIWQPDPSSFLRTPWSDSHSLATGAKRTTAMVLCQLMTREGTVDGLDIRHMVRRLLQLLRDDHKLIFKAAFEYEFTVYEKKTLKPLGSQTSQLLDLRTTLPDLDLLCELTEELDKAGFHVSSIQPEFASGMWEINFQPQEGLWAADFAFHVKNAIKIFFAKRGYIASFMTFPRLHGESCGLHLNHSLWTEDGQNAMRDDSQENNISELAMRWNAGILHHAVAMTALCCPTVNCYRRLNRPTCPSLCTWSVENRNGLNRFKNKDGNVYLESRLPSAAANSYLIIACHLAAGLSALRQEMTSPTSMDTDHAQRLPQSLEEAFQALDTDDIMKDALGCRFVNYYITAKREYEVNPCRQGSFITEEEKIEFEQRKYMCSL